MCHFCKQITTQGTFKNNFTQGGEVVVILGMLSMNFKVKQDQFKTSFKTAVRNGLLTG